MAALAGIIIWLGAIACGFGTMIYGWGLHAQSWPAVIGFTAGSVALAGVAVSLLKSE